MAELIREAALEGVRDELPHSLAVVIDEVNPREGRDDLIDVYAVLYVERESQKGIVIGKGGARLREVGYRRARPDREAAGHQGLSRPARQGRQELAERPQTAWPAWFLTLLQTAPARHADRPGTCWRQPLTASKSSRAESVSCRTRAVGTSPVTQVTSRLGQPLFHHTSAAWTTSRRPPPTRRPARSACPRCSPVPSAARRSASHPR